MSNKISGFTVTFENSVSEEYMDKVKNAIGLIDGTATVNEIVEDASTFIGQSQESYRIKKILIDLIGNDFNRNKK